MTDNKVCKACGAFKSLGEFHRNKNNPDGRERRCKACACAAQIRRYEANAGKQKTQARQEYERLWRLKHREKLLHEKVEWYQANKSKCHEASARWANDNITRRREICRASESRRRSENPDQFKEREREKRLLLSRSYILSQLALPAASVSRDLEQLKREQLLITRLARQLKKAADESRTEHP